MRIIRPAVKLHALINEHGHIEPCRVEYDVHRVFFFGLLAWATPNRIAPAWGEIEYIEDAKPGIILTYQLGWFRLEDA